MVSSMHAGSVGVSLLMTIEDGDSPVDLTGATTVEFVFRKPDWVGITKTATIYGAATDGVLRYVSADGDFDDVGEWRWQAHVVFPSSEFWSDIADLEVLPNITVP